ncbi:YggT family protein [Acidomonas methanolica]|nr:YggT family protein [Acidomonas methanolica]MCQ9154054.1 YggT family protein [Acidomonas methanolica]
MLVINLFTWALILACLMSMLLAFGVLDPRNRVVYAVADFLNRVTEPVLAPVRNLLPQMGAMDFSPLVVLLALQFIVVPALRTLFVSLAMHGV